MSKPAHIRHAFEQRHYVAIAKVLSDTYPQHGTADDISHHELITDELAKMFAADNPRFDVERFYRAADYSPITTD